MNPFTYLKNLAIEYNKDKNEMQKFYNKCLLLFIWAMIMALFVALYLMKS